MTHDARRLAGRTAFITGGSSGIGRSIAECFAQAGAGVVVTARDEAQLRETTRRCSEHGVPAHELVADLGASDFDAQELTAQATALAPEIDVFVSNAGAYFDVPFLEMTADRFDRTWRLNVRAGYLLAVEFARRWHAAGVLGRMIFVGSINGKLSEPVSTAYDISKAAIDGMVRTLCVELAPLGIRVNGLAPGLIHTAATSWLETNRERAEWVASHTPSREIPQAKVCGDAAVFLASDEADHVHGHVLSVDGGLAAIQYPDPPR
ncbi:MAG: gluconate 5-dehydrogenase [Solirubrobacteraceae bacterium]